MCKHILNAQTQIYAKCCKRWFECADCHREAMHHEIEKSVEMILRCKKCGKVFRIDISSFDEEADGFCPRCDNEWYIEAETPDNKKQMSVQLEAIEGVDQADLIRDERDQGKERRRQRMLEERTYKGNDDFEMINGLEDISDTEI